MNFISSQGTTSTKQDVQKFFIRLQKCKQMKNNRPKHGLNIKKIYKKKGSKEVADKEKIFIFYIDNVTISGNQIIGIYKVMQKMG